MKRPSHQCVFLGTFIIMVGVLKESRAQTICATPPVVVTKTSTSIEFQSQTNCSILNGSTGLDASKASGLTPGAIYSFNLTCQNCIFQITTNPAAITNLTVIKNTTSSVSLNWVKPEGIVTYYEVSWTDGISTGETNTSEISVNIPGLMSGVQYTFTVTALADDKVTAGDNTSISQYTQPASVQSLHFTQTTSSVSLNWANPEGNRSFYRVKWISGSDIVNQTGTYYIITGLTPGVQYTFTVSAVAGDNVTEGQSTNVSCYTKPDRVLDITSTQTTSSVFLNWTNPEGNRSFYRVKWINGSDIVNRTDTYYNITGLTPGVQYTFTVSAVAGDNVTEGQGTDVSCYTIPNPVADLFARHDSTTSVIVSWNKTLGWQTYYRYRVQTLNATSLVNKFETGNSSTMVTGLSPGTLYNFNVITVAAPGSESSPASTSSYTRPNAVTNLQGKNLNTTAIQLTWLQPVDYKPTYSYVVEVNHSYNQSTATKTYTFTDLVPGSPYSFRVFTVVEGVRSSEALTIAQTTPGMVTYLQTFVTTSNMTVTWRAPLGLVNSYSVQLYRGLQLEDNRTGLANNTDLVPFQGLRPGTLYLVKVLSLSGPLSNQANVSNATFPNPPGPITVTEQTTSSINITWSNPEDMTPDQYNFTVSYGAQTILISQNQFQLKSLLSGTAYNITVKTVGVLGYQSQVVMTTNFTKPASVQSLHFTQTTSSVSLNWANPEGNRSFYRVKWISGSDIVNQTGTYYIITGLTPGVQYAFTVSAVAGDNVTEGQSTNVSCYTKPDRVLDITSTQTTSSVFLNWTNPEGNRYFYRVKWINGSDIGNPTGTYYNITGLTPGVQYTFTVSAVAGDNVTEGQSTDVSCYTKPASVQSLRFTQTTSSVSLNWANPEGDRSFYRVKWISGSDIVNQTGTYYNITGLTPGVQYTFTVSAVAGDNVTEGQGTNVSCYTRPNAVTNLQGKNLNTTAIQLTWLQPADYKPTYSYVVEVNHSYNQSTATKTYTFTDLVPGSPYSFRVFTVVEGVRSSEALTIAQTTPGMVTYLQTFVTTSNMTVTWRAPLGLVNSYSVQLYRGLQLEDNRTGLANNTDLVPFQGLRPGTLYLVKVLSLSGPLSNQANVSNATFPNPPGPITVTEQTTSSINITWSKPADMIPDQYNFTVSYGAQPIPISQNQFQLKSLLSGTAYNITVTTVGVLGYQSQVVMTTNFTKPLSVSGLTEAEISTTSVTLVWVHPGPAFSYLVETTNPNGTLFNSITVYNKTATIPGLQSGSNYSFAVTTQTDDGTQAIPVTVFYFTRPYAIRSLTTYAVNTTTIFLNWTRPEQYQSGYTYSVSTTGCVLAPGTAANRTVLSEMAYINGLTPGAYCNLTVSVKAMNGIESSAVNAYQYTEPGVVQPIISRQSNSSLQVSWDVPPGNVEQYVVFLNDTSVVVYPNETDYVFSNLLPGRLYKAIVYTEVGPLRVPSNYTINATYPNPPGPIIVLVKTTSSLSLEWTEAPLMGSVSYEYQVTQISADGATRISAANNSVQLSDLLSGSPYNISVTTVGALFLQSQAVWAYLVTTRPHSVGSLMSIASEEHICLKWSPPSDPKPGYQYNVTWRSSYGNFSSTTAASELIIKNLVPGSPYNFTVTATTADGTQGAPVFTSNCTKAWQVSNLTCETPNDPDAKVILSWGMPMGMRHYFQVTATDVSHTDSTNRTVVGTATGLNKTLSGLRHFTNYTVMVQTWSCGPPSNVIILNCVTGITDPFIPPEAQSLISVVNYNHNSFTLQIKSSLFNNTNGPITYFCVLVSSVGANPVESDLTKTYDDWTKDPTITYLAMCKANDLRAAFEMPQTVVVGNAMEWNNYTNGALKSTNTYSFAVVLFTQLSLTNGIVNVRSSLKSIILPAKSVALPQNPVIISTAVGATLGIFGILFLVIIGFIIYWRTLAKKDTSDIQFQSMRAKVNVTVRVDDYEAYYKKQKADSNCGFAEEFEDLKTVGTAQSKNSALSQENKAKNRYNNVLPYDSSRVKLSIHGSPYDDYINANYIPGYNSKKEFIAAQGPLPGTVNEFWRMIWEKNVQTLVMLTRCNEQGRVKCEKYWPSDTKHFGNITVTTTSEIPLDDWTIRDFDVKNVRTAENRSIRHFHFTAWPDHGVPETTELLINFRHLVREHMEQYSQHSPTIVHCSAGVGRTGTLIAIDRLIFQIEREGMVDVYGVIHDLRMHRPLMVQTEDQYVFLNQCAMDIIRARTGTNVDLIYQNSAALTIYENVEPLKASHGNGLYKA